MLARADDADSLRRLLDAHARQRGRASRLALKLPAGLRASLPGDVVVIDDASLQCSPSAVFGASWLAPLHADDHYGADYLRDLALGWRYTSGESLGKAAFHRLEDDALGLQSPTQEYRRVPR